MAMLATTAVAILLVYCLGTRARVIYIYIYIYIYMYIYIYIVWVSFWDHTETTLGSFRDQFSMILGSLWHHLGIRFA